MDDQVGRDALHLRIDALRHVHAGRHGLAVLVGDRREALRQVVAHALVVLRRDRALGLAAGDVEEDARVVAALAPGGRLRPVDAGLAERHDRVGLGEQAEEALPAQPLVDADPAVHPLPAVVRHDEDRRVLVGALEDAPHEPVHVLVVVEDRVLERVARHVLAVLRVHHLPEAVVHAVDAHLDHGEELPRPRVEQVLGEGEAPVGHLVDLAQEVVLVVRAEVADVEEVLADRLLDLPLEHGRERVLAVDRRGQEAADHDPVERARRVGARDAEDDRGLAGARGEVPEARLLDRRRVGDEEVVVGVVGAVAEAVDAQVAGRPARHHAGPRRDGDRRDHGGEAAVCAALHEAGEHGELVAPALEQERGLRTVQSDDHHLRHRSITSR